MIALERASRALETLNLPHVQAVLESRLDAAARGDVSYADFLADLLHVEVTARQQAMVAHRLKHARLPFERTLEGFDFAFQPSVDKRLVKDLSTLAFVHEGHNVVLLGPPGVGKTHLAVGLGRKAIEAGYSVRFVKAHALVEDLRAAQVAGRLEKRLAVYVKPKVLIVDEFGVWPYDRLAATALFALVTARYERNALVLTSNKGFVDWGEVLGDAVVASAILDRLLHHSFVLNIKGESYRLREKKRAGLVVSSAGKEVVSS